MATSVDFVRPWCRGKLTTWPDRSLHCDTVLMRDNEHFQRFQVLSNLVSVSGKNAGVPKELSTLTDKVKSQVL